MDLVISPLEIKLNTNIPNQASISFTSSLLHHPSYTIPTNIGKYPYLISNAYFPEDALRNMEWEDRISFFFNLDTMRNTMANEVIAIKTGPEEKQLVENRNIFILIKSLFPTKYFVHKNIHQTLEYVTGDHPERSFFFNPFSQQFSYSKLNNKTYTNIRVTWKNDLLNHPVYYDLVKNTYDFRIKQRSEDARYADKYYKLVIEFNDLLREYVSRMLGIMQEYDENMPIDKDQNYHALLRIAIVNSVYQWINYENTDETFVKIFIMNIKQYNNELKNKVDDKYLSPREVDFASKKLFDLIEEKDEYINTIKDPLMRKQAKLELVFNEDAEFLTTNRLLIKLENDEKLKKYFNDYINYFNNQEDKMKKQYAILIKELNNVVVFQSYKRTPFLQISSQPDILKNNATYRRYYTNNIEKLLDTATNRDSMIPGNHKLYALLHTNKEEDIAYFFDFMEYVYEKYILYKTSSLPVKEEFVQDASELIYTGVDTVKDKKQVHFILDVIDGEVNDKNKRAYYCPFMNHYMGFLLSDFTQPNTFVKWKAAPYNFIVSTSAIQDKLTSTENKPVEELVLVPTSDTLDDNWEKFKNLVNIASREKIVDSLLILKKQTPAIDETDEFAFVQTNNPSLFSAIKNISKHIKKRDLNTMGFRQNLQALKELTNNYQSRFVYNKQLLDNLSTEQMDQYEKVNKDKVENELYYTISDNAVKYFPQNGGRKTRKKVKFAKKNNIVFIE